MIQRYFGYFQLLAGLGITVSAMTSGSGTGSFLNLLLFVLWGLVPFLLAYLFIATNAHRPRMQTFFIVVAIFNLLACAYAYYDSLFIHPDAQGGLVFLFAPLYLDIELLVLAAVGFIATRLLNGKNEAA